MVELHLSAATFGHSVSHVRRRTILNKDLYNLLGGVGNHTHRPKQLHSCKSIYTEVPCSEAIWWHRMQENPSACSGAPLRTRMGELTALSQSGGEGDWLPPLQESPCLGDVMRFSI